MKLEQIDTALAYSQALDALEQLVTKRELLDAFWMMMRVADIHTNRPVAMTLAVLIDRVNCVREMNHQAEPLAPAVDSTEPGAEYLALACVAAMTLAHERRRSVQS